MHKVPVELRGELDNSAVDAYERLGTTVLPAVIDTAVYADNVEDAKRLVAAFQAQRHGPTATRHDLDMQVNCKYHVVVCMRLCVCVWCVCMCGNADKHTTACTTLVICVRVDGRK